MEKMKRYFSKHVCMNSLSHLLLGIGLGFVGYRYLAGYDLWTAGLVLIGLGILGHVIALFSKK